MGNRKPCIFTETDVKRFVYAVTAAGLEMHGVDRREITRSHQQGRCPLRHEEHHTRGIAQVKNEALGRDYAHAVPQAARGDELKKLL